MTTYRTIFALLLAVFVAAPTQAVESAVVQYQAQLMAAKVGERIELDVDLSASPGFSVEIIGDLAEIRYRMAFNNVAEGWSWRPLGDVAVDDYYHFKFLPLQSVDEARGDYVFEDKIGVLQQMKVVWRYDYFLAFANLYDFYPRAIDDNAGFVARVPAERAHKVTMRVTARLLEPVVSESTTFWKATFGKPVDFTLKKRYLIGDLVSVAFIDGDSGDLLKQLEPQVAQR